MRARHLPLILLVVAVAAFTALNWPTLMTPTPLNLFFATTTAPMGLVMLSMLVAVTVVFALYMVVWQGSILAEHRRHAKELQQQRLLADQAEASRFTELQAAMQAHLARLGERIDQSEGNIRSEILDSANATLATLSELDDRLAGANQRRHATGL